VIVVTGPGRSGTSLLASLYKELGFDPGGGWRHQHNAGLEHAKFVKLNESLLDALGTSVPMGAKARRGRWGRHALGVDAFLAAERASGRPTIERLVRIVDWTRYRSLGLDVVDWSKLDVVVREQAENMKALCEEAQIVKDPRFCWTLPAWLAGGAPIEAVVLSVRGLDAMVDSRGRVFGNVVREHGRSWAKNEFVYGIGLAVASASEYRVPIETFRFPDFLQDPRGLYERLPLPAPRSWEEFSGAFERVVDGSLVHDDR